MESSPAQSHASSPVPASKGKRGSKRCPRPECQGLVPIHCSVCKVCNIHHFEIKHRPKKIKEVSNGQQMFCNLLIQESNPSPHLTSKLPKLEKTASKMSENKRNSHHRS